MISRRHFGSLTAALAAGTALAGLSACAGTTATILISKFSGYATAAQNFIDSVASAESLAGVLSSSDAATITGYAGTVDTIIQQITAAATSTVATVAVGTAQAWAQGIEGAVNDVVALLQKYGVKIPSSVSTVITAVEVVIPVLMAAVQLGAVSAARGGMSLSQAEAVLATKPAL